MCIGLKNNYLKTRLTWEFCQTTTATEGTDSFQRLQTVIGLIEKAEHRSQRCIYCLLGAEGRGLPWTWRGVCHTGPRDWSAQTSGGGVCSFCGLYAPSEPEVIATREQCVSSEVSYKSLHARISRSSRSPASSLLPHWETMMNCADRPAAILQVRLLCVFLLVMSR